MHSSNSQQLSHHAWRRESGLRLPPKATIHMQHREESQQKRHEVSPSVPNSPSSIHFETMSITGSSSFPLISGSPTHEQRYSLGRVASQTDVIASSSGNQIYSSGLRSLAKLNPRQMASQLRVDERVETASHSKMRVLPVQRVVVRPNSHALPEESRGSQAQTLARGREQHLEAEVERLKKKVQELSQNERQLNKTIDMLREELQVRSRSEKYLEQTPANLQHTNQQLQHYKVEVDKLMSENIRLKKELLVKKSGTLEEREMKVPASMSSLSAISEEHTSQGSQGSLSIDHTLIKESVLQSIDRIRDGLPKLNSLKESQVQLLKSSQGRYDYLQKEAAYQTTYYNLCSEAENLKQRLAMELNQLEQRKQLKKVAKEQRSDALRREVAELKQYIEEENKTKQQFLEELYRANELNKSVYRENGQLKAQIEQLRNRLLDSQRVTTSLSVEQHNREENNQLRSDNFRLLGEIKQLKSELERHNRSSSDQASMLRQLDQLKQQTHLLREQITTYKSKIGILTGSISELQRQLREKQRYAEQLQSSLTQVKPKKPFILNRSMQDKEQQYKDAIQKLQSINGQLQRKYAEASEQLQTLMRRQSYSNQSSARESVLKQFNQELQVKVASLQRQLTAHRETTQTNMTSRNKRIQELQQLCQQNDIQRQDHLAAYQRQMSKMLALTSESENRLRKELNSNLSEQLTKHQSEKAQYLGVIRQLNDQRQRSQQQHQQRQRELLSKDLQSEKQISKLLAENESLKLSLQSQVEKLAQANSQHSKQLIDKYERDMLQLNSTNKQLQAENKSVSSVMLQNSSLTAMVKQLQLQVRERSMVVDHLWEIKKVEYENVQKQLVRLRQHAMSPRGNP